MRSNSYFWRMEFEIGYTEKEITPWGGMVFMRQMMEKMGLKKALDSQPDLPVSGSNRGYSATTILEAFMVSIWCGANRFLHTEITRHDEALSKIFNWKRTPGQDTYKRFFNKFTQAKNQRVSDYFYSWIFDQVKFNNFTLDCDSSVMPRYGTQQGSKKGYNPAKRGRPSHHPLIAFIADIKLVANMWLRSGDASSSNNFLSFLEDTLSKLKNKAIGLIRLDSGFCSNEIFNHLEQKSIDYIVAAKFYQPVQQIISRQQAWIIVDDGIEISEVEYQAANWTKARRMVIVRQKIKDRPNAIGKTLTLFDDASIYRQYRYTAYFTTLKLSATEVWRIYRNRADAENRIKELKYDFGFSSFNLDNFYATEAALTFAMLSYNIMSLFRMFILQSKTQHTLSTLRYKTFAIGAYFEKTGERFILKLALNMKRREWCKGLWNQSNSVNYPFHFSIA